LSVAETAAAIAIVTAKRRRRLVGRLIAPGFYPQ